MNPWETLAIAVVLGGGWPLAIVRDRMRDGGAKEAVWGAAAVMVALGGVALVWRGGSNLYGAVGFVAGLALFWIVLPLWLFRRAFPQARHRCNGQENKDSER